MAVALRAHHLLCMLTYLGKGYSEAFVRQFDAVVQRLNQGEDILLVGGPDEVCAPLAGDACAHCHQQSVGTRDACAAQALAPWLDQPLVAGSMLRLTPDRWAALRAAFARPEVRAACAGCPWEGLCTQVADNGFVGARLQLRHAV